MQNDSRNSRGNMSNGIRFLDIAPTICFIASLITIATTITAAGSVINIISTIVSGLASLATGIVLLVKKERAYGLFFLAITIAWIVDIVIKIIH